MGRAVEPAVAPAPAVVPAAAPEVTTAAHTIDVTKLTPLFKMVFLTITGLTVLAFAANLILVLVLDKPGDEAKSFLELCSTISKMGFAAIVGLIGGKAI